jgi:hypothetical protein
MKTFIYLRLQIFPLYLISEKAGLLNSLRSYETQLEEEQSKKWVPDEDVHNCTKCNVAFSWAVRKVCYLILDFLFDKIHLS